MTFSGDPYRILGLAPGASLDDVKRAYRRLAKQYHPDAAGPDAIVRFLAIQGAYEALADPGRRGRMPGRGAGRPSQADPDRAQATRDTYRAGRSGGWGSRPGSGPGTGDDPWRGWTRRGSGTAPPGDAGANAGARSGSGTTDPRRRGPSSSGPATAGTSGGPASGGTAPSAASGGTASGATSGGRGSDGTSSGAPRGRRAGRAAGRGPSEGAPAGTTQPNGRASGGRPGDRKPNRRRATLSSTSYDDAAQEPRHPEWQGSSWYGTSSGTYWTINPREYADPRKHGPEYQARARRAASSPEPALADEAAARPTGASAPFARWSAGDAAWSDTGNHAAPAASAPSHGIRSDAPAEPADAPSAIPTAGSIGLLAGALAAIPAAVIALGAIMDGDLSLAAVAIAIPFAVTLAAGVAVGLLHRGPS